MKVLLVITKATWGGATKYVYDMACSLHKSGTKVAVAYGSKGVLTEKLDELSIPHYHISGLTRDLGFFRELKAYKGILSIIDEFEPDIVHVNSSKGGISAFAARLRGKKVVFTSHGWAFNERRNLLSKFIFKIAYFFTMVFSQSTILVSQALREQIASWPFKKKLDIIPNGIELKNILGKTGAREALAKLETSLLSHLSEIWLMTIAELHDSKGIDTMLSALATFREEETPLPHYLVLGEGDERWRLEKLIESYDLQENVHLLGFVENAASYLKAADIFVLPSRTEALGYVLLEAGMASIPVVASRVGGIPEIIDHNRNGLLVPPGSSAVFAVAISDLLTDKHKQSRLAKALHEDVLLKNSLEGMVSRTKEIYTRLLRE
jgi:glycosyltransferase involved in cell wall biosynthesis